MSQALEFARLELRPSVSETPIGVHSRHHGNDDIVRLDAAGLQFIYQLFIEFELLRTRSVPARDSDEDGVLAPLDTETGILDDKVRFRVLLIDLIAVAQGYPKGRKNRPMDGVKKVLDLLLIAAFVGINSKKWHCVLLMAKKLALSGRLERLRHSPPFPAGFNSSWSWQRAPKVANGLAPSHYPDELLVQELAAAEIG